MPKVRAVTPVEAREQERCDCSGCPACRAKDGGACGVTLAFRGYTKCSWCRQYGGQQ